MQHARNEKGAPAGGAAETPNSKSREKDSPSNLNPDTPQRKTRGGALAESIWKRGSLADRLRCKRQRDVGRTRCPACGEPDPGFIDSEAPAQGVECDECDHKSVLRAWRRAAQLVDVVRTVSAHGDGHYGVSFSPYGIRISHREAGDSRTYDFATVHLMDAAVTMPASDAHYHTDLVETLEEFGYFVREEG